MNDNDNIDTDINDTYHSVDLIIVIGLLNIHNFPQDNQSSKLDYINMIVENGVDNGHYCYIDISTIYVIKNHNIVEYTNKRD